MCVTPPPPPHTHRPILRAHPSRSSPPIAQYPYPLPFRFEEEDEQGEGEGEGEGAKRLHAGGLHNKHCQSKESASNFRMGLYLLLSDFAKYCKSPKKRGRIALNASGILQHTIRKYPASFQVLLPYKDWEEGG